MGDYESFLFYFMIPLTEFAVHHVHN